MPTLVIIDGQLQVVTPAEAAEICGDDR